ncbi:MAG: excinuclease ABC subunit UvrA, partial [Terriglobales bacterium]
MESEAIRVRGARQHNLRGVDCDLPLNRLIVVTGVSGSGKSSLAFDTIYAEGQRRYVESLSAYARQFLERMEKPAVDAIEGITPAVAIRQKNATRNPRSTVATATEIYDYLRLMFARAGETICPDCGIAAKPDSVDQAADAVLAEAAGRRAYVLFPLPATAPPAPAIPKRAAKARKPGARPAPPPAPPVEALADLRRRGFPRLYQAAGDEPGGEGIMVEFATPESLLELDFSRPVFAVADRLAVEPGERGRIAEAIETAYRESGEVQFEFPGENGQPGRRRRFSSGFECRNCGRRFTAPEPRLFSFNNPYGACPRCQGFGNILSPDWERIVPEPGRTLAQGAIEPWTKPRYRAWAQEMRRHAATAGVPLDVPWRQLRADQREWVAEGEEDFEGVRGFFAYLDRKKYKLHVRVFLSRYRSTAVCPACHGARLRPEALQVQLRGPAADGRKEAAWWRIDQVCALTAAQAQAWIAGLQLGSEAAAIAAPVRAEITRRLGYLLKVGLDYLTLDRLAATLSGGESQRIQLASCLGSGLVGSLYVLDEPSIGLHSRDTQRLIGILSELRDLGNTVLVVEHDAQVMRAADYILDLGPAAGEGGGQLVAAGNPFQIAADPQSRTGRYLSGAEKIATPAQRRTPGPRRVIIRRAHARNLKGFDVEIPLGMLVAVTGVSGSGKSTLVHEVLYRGWEAARRDAEALGADEIAGAGRIREMVLVDQSPIGRTPRSNPVTYLKAFDGIRALLAATPAAQRYGLGPGAFSFNVPGGRCDACEGQGVVAVEMQFLADVELPCEECDGRRFKPEVLEVRWRDKNVDQILQLTVREAERFFAGHAKITRPLELLSRVGLGYLRLGQSATTLSGGEAQRVKLAAHLARPESAQGVMFLLDEPTTGLHFADIAVLLDTLEQLIRAGGSVVVIEHNLDVIQAADWVIDLGPEGGDGGGQLLAAGPPEAIAADANSLTGR